MGAVYSRTTPSCIHSADVTVAALKDSAVSWVICSLNVARLVGFNRSTVTQKSPESINNQ